MKAVPGVEVHCERVRWRLCAAAEALLRAVCVHRRFALKSF